MIASGVAWVVLSPAALVLALISSVHSLVTYYLQLAAFATWTAGGVLCGIGTLTSAKWAGTLKGILCWIAFAYFGGCGLLIAGYTVVYSRDRTGLAVGLTIAAMVVATAVPFLALAIGDSERQQA